MLAFVQALALVLVRVLVLVLLLVMVLLQKAWLQSCSCATVIKGSIQCSEEALLLFCRGSQISYGRFAEPPVHWARN